MKQFFFCVDFGGLTDYTAIAILHRVLNQEESPDGRRPIYVENPRYYSAYKLRYLERFPLGMTYPEQVEKIKTMMEHPSLHGRTQLLADVTSNVSTRQIMQDKKMNPIGIWITSGRTSSPSQHGYNVPKSELAAAINSVYQSRRIKVPYGLPFRKEYEKELEGFEPKLTDHKTLTYEAAQAAVHDDLVMAVAMGLWYGEKVYTRTYTPTGQRVKAVTMKDPLRGK